MEGEDGGRSLEELPPAHTLSDHYPGPRALQTALPVLGVFRVAPRPIRCAAPLHQLLQ